MTNREGAGESRLDEYDPVARIVLAVGLAALLARALPALVQAFWVDEAGTWWLIDGGWSELVARWRGWPYQSLAHSAVALAAKQLLGASEWALRLPSFVAALASLGLLHRLARHLIGPSGAAATLLAVAGGPSFYFALTMARPYALGMLALLLSWSALVVWERPSEGQRLAVWALASAAVVYCHYTLALGVAAQLPWLARRWRAGDGRTRRALALAAAAAALACLPLAGALRATARAVPELDMFWEMAARSHPLATFSPTVLGLSMVLVVATAIACGAWPVSGALVCDPRALRVIAPLWLLPLATTYAAHRLGLAALNYDRYQLAGHLGLALAVGLTVEHLATATARRAALALLALVAPFTAVSSHWPLYDGTDWRAAAKSSARIAPPAELVLVPSPFIEANHPSHFAELASVGRLSANLVAYPLARPVVVLPRDVLPATTEFAERRFEQLGLRERRRFALLQISRGPWYAWLLREHPEFTPVEVYRWRQLEWLVFERRDTAAKPSANPAAGS